MPIDYSKYPANWHSEIRPRILERDGHKCNFCGIPNYAIVRGHPFSIGGLPLADIVDRPPFAELKTIMWQDAVMKVSDKEASRFCLKMMKDGLDCQLGGFKYIQIVLTIAHLHDPDPMNCDDGNLAALCQKCHNTLDAPMRKRNRAKSRVKKTGQMSIFED